MFGLTCDIQISGAAFKTVHEVTIKRSLYDLAATATVKVPVTAVLRQSGEPPAHIETAQAVKVGDDVRISLGYDGQNKVEFIGFVKRLNYKVPLEIECEDYFYKTRFQNVVFSDKETTLKQLLNTVLPAAEIGHAAELTLKNFVVNNKPASWVLGLLKKEYGLNIFFDINGKLYACGPTDVTGEKVNYRLRYNVLNDDELKYQLAEDIKLKVKAICYMKDGEKVEAEIGADDGATKTLYFYDVKNERELKTLAGAELNRHSFDGYRGKIITFLQPYALPGMVAAIDDPIYNERGGDYLIESTETTFGTSGARRTLEIGIKI